MRYTMLLLGTLLFLALAGTASAQCYGCNVPCEGPEGPNYECNYWHSTGYYGECWNLEPCGGCIGWFDRSCFESAELQPKEPAPLLGVQRVTAVVVRHDPAPVRRPEPIQVALAR